MSRGWQPSSVPPCPLPSLFHHPSLGLSPQHRLRTQGAVSALRAHLSGGKNDRPAVFPSFPGFLRLFLPRLLTLSISTAITTSISEDESYRLATKSLPSQASADVLASGADGSPSPETQEFAARCRLGTSGARPSPYGEREVTLGRSKRREETWAASCISQPFASLRGRLVPSGSDVRDGK